VSGFRWSTTENCDRAAGLYDGAYGLPGLSDAYPYSTGSNFSQGWGHPVRHHRRILYVKPDVFVVADTLIPLDGVSHEYDVRWHLNTVNTRIVGEEKRVFTEDNNAAN